MTVDNGLRLDMKEEAFDQWKDGEYEVARLRLEEWLKQLEGQIVSIQVDVHVGNAATLSCWRAVVVRQVLHG